MKDNTNLELDDHQRTYDLLERLKTPGLWLIVIICTCNCLLFPEHY